MGFLSQFDIESHEVIPSAPGPHLCKLDPTPFLLRISLGGHVGMPSVPGENYWEGSPKAGEGERDGPDIREVGDILHWLAHVSAYFEVSGRLVFTQDYLVSLVWSLGTRKSSCHLGG